MATNHGGFLSPQKTRDLQAECDRLREAIQEALGVLGDSSKAWVVAGIQAERVLKNALGPKESS